MPSKKLSVFLFVILLLFIGQTALADRTYISSADFEEGELINVNPNKDQLQLDMPTISPFVYVVASGRGTVLRLDADTGEILGEYRTAPLGRERNPSRTSVDSKGNVWTANRDEDQPTTEGGEPSGSVVKIGIVIGGTRLVDPETGEMTEYIQGPFRYNTCVDRNNDGLIRTSRGLGDILSWPGGTDQIGGEDGIVEWAEDECILLYQRLPGAPNAHHVSVDADDNVWVGGYAGFNGNPLEGGSPNLFYHLNGHDASIIDEDSFSATDLGCGGFGGLVDANGILWSASPTQNMLLRYDPHPAVKKGACIDVAYSWGLAADTQGVIWNSMWFGQAIQRVNPDGSISELPFSTSSVGGADTGVAVTPADNNIWIAKDFNIHVVRLDDNGNIKSVINLWDNPTGISGDSPNGIAVDARGRVWVTNLSSNNVMRINPGTEQEPADVDLTVDLGNFADPDNYGNMTGAVAPEGIWTVIHDSQNPGNPWGVISWNSSEPEGTRIVVEARAAETEDELAKLDDLPGQGYTEVENGMEFNMAGQLIQIRVTFQPNEKAEGVTPVLFDLAVKSAQPQGQVCDLNDDSVIDIYDILGVFFTIGDSADQPFDPRDWDADGTITIIDARGCVLQCTYAYCQPADTCSE